VQKFMVDIGAGWTRQSPRQISKRGEDQSGTGGPQQGYREDRISKVHK
jgi:hypothetical protein